MTRIDRHSFVFSGAPSLDLLAAQLNSLPREVLA